MDVGVLGADGGGQHHIHLVGACPGIDVLGGQVADADPVARGLAGEVAGGVDADPVLLHAILGAHAADHIAEVVVGAAVESGILAGLLGGHIYDFLQAGHLLDVDLDGGH